MAIGNVIIVINLRINIFRTLNTHPDLFRKHLPVPQLKAIFFFSNGHCVQFHSPRKQRDDGSGESPQQKREGPQLRRACVPLSEFDSAISIPLCVNAVYRTETRLENEKKQKTKTGSGSSRS